jgi:dGTPase
VKYFNTYDSENEKCKFIYGNSKDQDSDYSIINKIIGETKIAHRTLDVQIVDLADEIAYATHDLEDGLAQGFFTIDEIMYELERKYPYRNSFSCLSKEKEDNQRINQFFKALVCIAQREAKEYAKNVSDYKTFFNNILSSKLTYYCIRDLGLIPVDEKHKTKTGTTQKIELGFVKLYKLVKGLKEITFKCVCNSDDVYNYEQAGDKVICALFDLYYEHIGYLPLEYRVISEKEYRKLREKRKKEKKEKSIILTEDEAEEFKRLDQQHRRNIIDYISGMMDSFAIKQYEHFFGKKALDGFYSKDDFIINH